MQDEIIIDGNEQPVDAPVDQDAANAETDKLNADTKVIYTPQEVAAFFQKFADENSSFSNSDLKWIIRVVPANGLPTVEGGVSNIAGGFQVLNNMFNWGN